MRTGLTITSIVLSLLVAACSPIHRGPEITGKGVFFSFSAPKAKSVAIAGSFNAWNTSRDSLSGPDKKGLWSITLPLRQGRYEYLFIVDGKDWQPDPAVPQADDGFGGRNSVLIVPEGY